MGQGTAVWFFDEKSSVTSKVFQVALIIKQPTSYI